MKFSPFNFQAPLAAGGVTLMAFNWLQFAVPHAEGSVRLSDVRWAGLTMGQTILYGLLVALMALLTTANLTLTVVFVNDLVRWVRSGDGFREFMSGPAARVTGIFVPIASLAMTMAVVFASLPFFIPGVTAGVPTLIIPALILFWTLLLTSFALESQILKSLLNKPLDIKALNFVWLLDVFAFGLMSLAGTGLAAMASSRTLAAVAAIASGSALGVGSVLLVGKLGILVYAQVRSRALPDSQLQPAFFLVVPITCLYGVSYYRLMLFGHRWFELDTQAPSQFLISSLYVVAIIWTLFTLYLLRGYFRSYFRTSEYFPTQWALV